MPARDALGQSIHVCFSLDRARPPCKKPSYIVHDVMALFVQDVRRRKIPKWAWRTEPFHWYEMLVLFFF